MQSFTVWQQATVATTRRDHSIIYLFTSHIFVCCSFRTSHLWSIALSTQYQLRGWNNILHFLKWTAPIARFFCDGCILDDLHILVKASLCCDWKRWEANAQSLTLWEQATIENPRRARSISACLCLIYMGVVEAERPSCMFEPPLEDVEPSIDRWRKLLVTS